MTPDTHAAKRPMPILVDKPESVRGQYRPVGELDIVANQKRPSQTIIAASVLLSQVVDEIEVLIGGDECGLDKGLVHMFAAAPRIEGVEACFRLAAGVYCDNHLVRCARGARPAWNGARA